jgi:hypothetical protein
MDQRKKEHPHPTVSGETQTPVIPHPPYSPGLAPCYSILFPKMKLKPKWRRFDTTEEIHAESQTVFDILTEKDFRKRSKNGEYDGTGVYMREGTTSRVLATDRPYDEFYNVYSVSTEYSWYLLVCCVNMWYMRQIPLVLSFITIWYHHHTLLCWRLVYA